jgi:lipoprotein Spr
MNIKIKIHKSWKMKNSVNYFFRYSFFILLLMLITLVMGCTSSKRYTRPSYREQIKTKTKRYKDKKHRARKKQRSVKEAILERKLKRVVKSYLGVKYHFGGTSRRGMDCSGFVWRVFQDLGRKNFPRTSSAQLTRLGRRVLKKNARPGDLIFFRNRNRVDHVGIYMGNKEFAHASRGQGVIYTSVYDDYFRKRFFCIRRIL